MSECKSDEVLLAEIDRLKKESRIVRLSDVHIKIARALIGAAYVSILASGVVGGMFFVLQQPIWQFVATFVFAGVYILSFSAALAEEFIE